MAVDINALLGALPISGLEPAHVATLSGFVDVAPNAEWKSSISLLEPPANRRVPFIEPTEALARLLGMDAQSDTVSGMVTGMKAHVDTGPRVMLMCTVYPDAMECVPVSGFVAWARDEKIVASDVADFLDHAAQVAASTPVFGRHGNRGEMWALASSPAVPPPEAMIEFVPMPGGAPWAFPDMARGMDGHWAPIDDGPYMPWREMIRPAVVELERSLGKQLYYFAGPDYTYDDDYVHRFLILHWLCTHKPGSLYVRYLLDVSGAHEVGELKRALLDPASYVHPFEIDRGFDELLVRPLKLRFGVNAR